MAQQQELSDKEPSPGELGNKNSLSVQEMNVRFSGVSMDEQSGSPSINFERDLLQQKALHFEKYYKGRLTNEAFKEKVATCESTVPENSFKTQSGQTSVVIKEINYDDVNNTNTAVKGPVIALPAANSDAHPRIEKTDSPDSLKQPNDFYAETPFADILKILVEQDNKDKALLMLMPFKVGLEKELKGWTDWVNENIIKATGMLSKYQAELKTLRQEMAEIEKTKQEKQAGEESNAKRLTEMEYVLANANRQIEEGNGAIIRLEVESRVVKREIEEARMKTMGLEDRVEEASKWARELGRKLAGGQEERSMDVEMVNSARRRVAELEKRNGKAGNCQNQFKVLQKQVLEENVKIQNQYTVLRTKREKGDALREAESDNILQTGQKRIQKFKDESKNLSRMISEWKLESDKSTIAEPEMECVMCMDGEIVVTFLPCAHQLLCTECNDLHERQGLRDCPSCRATIVSRVSASYRTN